MQLVVRRIASVKYTCGATSLPFDYSLILSESTVVVGSIDINTCMLVNMADNEIMVGWSLNILRLRNTEVELKAGTHSLGAFDAMEHEEEQNTLVPGNYEHLAKATVFVKRADGVVKPRTLNSSLLVAIS